MTDNQKQITPWRLLLSLGAACALTAALAQRTTSSWWPGVVLGALFWGAGALTLKLRPTVGYLTSWAFLSLVVGSVGFLLGALAPSVLVEGGWWAGARAGATLGSSLVLVAAVMIVPPRYIWRTCRSLVSFFVGRRATSAGAVETRAGRQRQAGNSAKKKRSMAKSAQRRARKVTSRSRR